MDYMWTRCEGCKAEGNGLDDEFRNNHRFCVANLTAQVPEPAPSPIVWNGPKVRSVVRD